MSNGLKIMNATADLMSKHFEQQGAKEGKMKKKPKAKKADGEQEEDDEDIAPKAGKAPKSEMQD